MMGVCGIEHGAERLVGELGNVAASACHRDVQAACRRHAEHMDDRRALLAQERGRHLRRVGARVGEQDVGLGVPRAADHSARERPARPGRRDARAAVRVDPLGLRPILRAFRDNRNRRIDARGDGGARQRGILEREIDRLPLLAVQRERPDDRHARRRQIGHRDLRGIHRGVGQQHERRDQ